MVEIIGGWIVRSDIFDFESQVKKISSLLSFFYCFSN